MARDRVFRLPLFGATKEVAVPVPGGKGSLSMLLPAARKLTHAIMTAAVEHDRASGHRVTCKAGCAACCRHLVPVGVAEAKALGDALARLPPPRRDAIKRRFEAALSKMEGEGLAAPRGPAPRTSLVATPGADDAWRDVSRRYQALAIPCPFLENERCAVYDERPFVCREHMVTTDPRACTTGVGARAVPRPYYMTPALAAVVRELDGIAPSIVPLPFILEWLEANRDELGAD
ncbi:MAG TPA: hypothetical protein VL400_12145, partial [Polyangiaceae bacterium]|nr:hypothetical protein [Polyangiaceae bacterium]